MPLPDDETLLKTATDLIAQFKVVFGKHPGFRPAHAKGILVSGTFKPSPEAATLSKAPHFSAPSTPIWVRFSNSTGLPLIPDTDDNADPRGIAIRFNLGDRKHTDVIAHSTPFFPVRTGAEFLEFLQNLAAGTISEFLGTHPKALAHVTAPKPAPISYGTDTYFSVTAFKLINSSGKETIIRYRVIPEAGVHVYSKEEWKKQSDNYLQDELKERFKKGPIVFKLVAQIAEEGDVTDDATVQWPEDRKVMELGSIKVEEILRENAEEQRKTIFDPIPRVEGVEPSEDPLLEFRAALYLISGRERRAGTA